MEQSQSVTFNAGGAITSNLTRPQWQLPVCVIIVQSPAAPTKQSL